MSTKTRQLGVADMVPERKAVSKSAKSVFYEEINDVDVYVEDTGLGYDKLHRILFSRIFDGKYRIEKIFPLGGREEVIDRFFEEREDVKRPSLYVVDGDLYLLCGDSVSSGFGLYVFPFYCMENILLDGVALEELLDEEEPVLVREKVCNEFKYEQWLSGNVDFLFELFLEYAVTNKINPDMKTVGYKAKDLVSDNTGFLDEEKVSLRIMNLREENIGIVGGEVYEELRREVLARFSSSGLNKEDVVSAKDYFFPLIRMRFNRVVRNSISDINFKQRLARKCNLEKIKGCENYLIGCD